MVGGWFVFLPHLRKSSRRVFESLRRYVVIHMLTSCCNTQGLRNSLYCKVLRQAKHKGIFVLLHNAYGDVYPELKRKKIFFDREDVDDAFRTYTQRGVRQWLVEQK